MWENFKENTPTTEWNIVPSSDTGTEGYAAKDQASLLSRKRTWKSSRLSPFSRVLARTHGFPDGDLYVPTPPSLWLVGNQPWWRYWHYVNWQMLYIRTPLSLPNPGLVGKHLPAYHLLEPNGVPNYCREVLPLRRHHLSVGFMRFRSTGETLKRILINQILQSPFLHIFLPVTTTILTQL